jgi:hypothetical protein
VADFVKGNRKAAQNLLPVEELSAHRSPGQKGRLWPVDVLGGMIFLAWQNRSPNALLKKLAWLGRCSLGLYAVHLSLFFSVAMPGGSWAARVAARLSFFEVTGLAAALLAASVALYLGCARGVRWVRQKIHLAKIELRLL